jgi:hypothetical protein
MTTSTTAAEKLSDNEWLEYIPEPDYSEEDISAKEEAPGRKRKTTPPDRARRTISPNPHQLLLIIGTASRRQPKKPAKLNQFKNG